MTDVCKHCGAKLGQHPSTCPSCHTKVDSATDTPPNKPLDEIKKNLLDMSSKAISMAKVVGADIANETKKINEARKETVASEELKGAENKKIAFKNGVRIFWQKLNGKQKAIVAGVPLFLFIGWMAASGTGDPDIAGCAKPAKSGQFERCTELLRNGSQQLVGSKLYGTEIWGLKYRKESGFDVVELQFSSSTTRTQALSTMNKLCQNNMVLGTDNVYLFSAVTKPQKGGEPWCQIQMLSTKNEGNNSNGTPFGVFKATTINWK